MKGVFEISGASKYDDLISERYHFPIDYLPVAKRLVGGWVVYRETRAAGGRMSYVAAGRVSRIDPDPADRKHFYARIDDFLEFDRPVPYRNTQGRFAERFLREMARPADAGRTLQGESVRIVEDSDFADIVTLGLSDTLDPSNRTRLELDEDHIDSDTSILLDAPHDDRRIVSMLVNKKIRAAGFRNHVLSAYDNTCAVTRLRMVNGGGKAEAQAAHIWAVADGGPDMVRNGIALSATAHWLFDRHLISLDDEFRLLVSHNRVPEEFCRLFPPSGEPILLPKDPALLPRRDFVARHRERFVGTPGF